MLRAWVHQARAAIPRGLRVAVSVALLFSAAAVTARDIDADPSAVLLTQADPGRTAMAARTVETVATSAADAVLLRRTRRLQDTAGEDGLPWQCTLYLCVYQSY